MRSKEEVLELLNFLFEPETASDFVTYEVNDNLEKSLRLIYLNGFLYALQYILDEELQGGDILNDANFLIASFKNKIKEEIQEVIKHHETSYMHNKIFNAVQTPENHPFTKVCH